MKSRTIDRPESKTKPKRRVENPVSKRVTDDLRKRTGEAVEEAAEPEGGVSKIEKALSRAKVDNRAVRKLILALSYEEKWQLVMKMVKGELKSKHAESVARELLELAVFPADELKPFLEKMSDKERADFCIFFMDCQTVVVDTDYLLAIASKAVNDIKDPRQQERVTGHGRYREFFSPLLGGDSTEGGN